MKSKLARAVVVVSALAVVASVIDVGSADAKLYRRSRSTSGPVFEDVRVCKDGIEFAIGRWFQASAGDIDFDNLPASVPEEVTLFQYAPGAGGGEMGNQGRVVLDRDFTSIPLVEGVTAVRRLAPNWGDGDGGFLYPAANLTRVTLGWTGGERLRPGTEIIGRLGFEQATLSELNFADPQFGSGPLVVGRCKVFKAVKAKVDVRPGDRGNLVAPGSATPVPFAILSGRGFDASATNPATVRIGTAPVQSPSTADVDLDGDLDFTASFVPAASGIACGLRTTPMSASSLYGWPIKGKAKFRATC